MDAALKDVMLRQILTACQYAAMISAKTMRTIPARKIAAAETVYARTERLLRTALATAPNAVMMSASMVRIRTIALQTANTPDAPSR